MAETINTAEAAVQISEEIFSTFKWNIQELYDQNLDCVFEEHDKKTHPCDCVFYYIDPYKGKYIYFNTDLKSYSKESIQNTSVSNAMKSLTISVHCASVSDSWQKKYLLPESVLDYEIRGFLFVYNHDDRYSNDFHEQIAGLKLNNLPIAESNILHVMGPSQIEDCYSIAADLNTAIGKLDIEKYTFWYPDMIMHKVKHGEYWEQPATIELLSSAVIIVKYQKKTGVCGYIIYYKRDGAEVDEFVYLIDMLSHYQILSEGLEISLRFIGQKRDSEIRTNFKNAVYKYMQVWNMDEVRESQLNLIKPLVITRQTAHYNIGELGWRNSK
jgi:hypothetical protein